MKSYLVQLSNMKPNIHPQYYSAAKITCGCGNTLVVGSTVETTTVEICSACHPFYTGKQKLIDAAGRLERFERRASKKTEASISLRKGKKIKSVARSVRRVQKKVEGKKTGE